MKRLHFAGPIIALTLAAGCGGEASSGSGGSGGSGGSPPSGGLTYYKDTKPIFDAKCNGCHFDGGIAPFSLETYEAAAPYAGLIKQKVVDKVMPPWPADPACGEYEGDRSLTDEQIKTIAQWVDDGAQKGDPKDEGPALDQGPVVELSRVDSSLSMPAEYTPQKQPDDYRCFVLDWPQTETMYVTGFRANPGNPKVVHHVIAFLAAPGSDADKAVQLDAAEPGEGYTCFGGSGAGQSPWIGAWAPGSRGEDFPTDTGIKIEPGSKIILQVHYNTLTAGAQPDKTTIDFKLDKTVAKEAKIQPWTNPQWVFGDTMKIPANEADVMHSWEFDASQFLSGGQPFTIYSANLHMHTLGTRAKFTIKRAGGEECMLDIPRWDFHWQGSYRFGAPKTFNPGDKLYLECHWDNTPPKQPIIDGKPQVPKDVYWGEGTTDEMCLGGFYYTKD